MIDALNMHNLKDALELQGKLEDVLKKRLKEDESDGVLHHLVLSDIRFEVLCNERELCEEDMGDSREQLIGKEH